MGKPYFRASRRRTKALMLVNQLIAEISASCQRAQTKGDPGLVGLKKSLRKTRRLRLTIQRDVHCNWEKVGEAIVYIGQILNRLYSLLHNCLQWHKQGHEAWEDHTVATSF